MEVRVNGKPREVDEGTTLADLVVQLGFAERTVVVERNGEPVPRGELASVRIEAGDVLEVVRPVQGGASAPDALERAKLYLVCGASMPLDVLDACIGSGVGIVQLREKDAEATEVMEHAAGFMDVCRSHGIPFVVNDRPDIARALGADGVHLGQGDLPPAAAREICGPEAIIGRSTHDRAQIETATSDHEAGLVDYIAVGPVHPTPTKPGRPGVGYELVCYAAERVGFPWFAIGGIDPDNVTGVVEAGARRIVVVRAITEAPDPPAAAKALLGALP